MHNRRRFLCLVILCGIFAGVQAQVLVTLSPTPSPAAGQPGVTSINLTGSNFPSGTILPADTTVTLEPAGGGTPVTTKAAAVTVIVGTTRRVTFVIPSSISVSVPTAYLVSLSGTTTAGAAFASSNKAALTINPGAAILSVTPASGQQGGLNLLVTIRGQLTTWVQGATQVSFGAGISVGGVPDGALGPVTVINATTATATIRIAPVAAPGPRTVVVQTGAQQASLSNGFTVTSGAPGILSATPNSGQQGYGPEGFTPNVFLVPLVGGAGGDGGETYGGGAGGGALLIASSTSITVNGAIVANGGDSLGGAGGGGGAIRLVSPVIEGSNGFLSARGGQPQGADGRIRFEAFDNRFAGSLNGTPFAQGKPFGLFLPPV